MQKRFTATFWTVWCPTGGAPTVAHPSLSLATMEAERLARAHPGQQFVVMKSVAGYERNELTVTDLSDANDQPF